MRRITRITEGLVTELRKIAKDNGTAAAKADAVAAETFQPNCLIVEDDETDAELSSIAVEAVGDVNATVVRSGDEALEILKQVKEGFRRPFHIVFLDLNLVGSRAQGKEVLKFIRENMPKLHTVIVSGFIDETVVNYLLNDRIGGCGSYLGIVRKPLQKESLEEILDKHRMKK